MGIEPKRLVLPELVNKPIGATEKGKCDGRANIYAMWGHVRLREPTVATSLLGCRGITDQQAIKHVIGLAEVRLNGV